VAKKSKEGKKPYHRRSGVIWRAPQLGVPREPRFGWFWQSVWVNDGGEDEPLSRRGRVRYRELLLALFVVFVVLVLLTYRGY
jgi:hypothetical protein